MAFKFVTAKVWFQPGDEFEREREGERKRERERNKTKKKQSLYVLQLRNCTPYTPYKPTFVPTMIIIGIFALTHTHTHTKTHQHQSDLNTTCSSITTLER
jgi:hypothetical protein